MSVYTKAGNIDKRASFGSLRREKEREERKLTLLLRQIDHDPYPSRMQGILRNDAADTTRRIVALESAMRSLPMNISYRLQSTNSVEIATMPACHAFLNSVESGIPGFLSGLQEPVTGPCMSCASVKKLTLQSDGLKADFIRLTGNILVCKPCANKRK